MTQNQYTTDSLHLPIPIIYFIYFCLASWKCNIRKSQESHRHHHYFSFFIYPVVYSSIYLSYCSIYFSFNPHQTLAHRYYYLMNTDSLLHYCYCFACFLSWFITLSFFIPIPVFIIVPSTSVPFPAISWLSPHHHVLLPLTLQDYHCYLDLHYCIHHQRRIYVIITAIFHANATHPHQYAHSISTQLSVLYYHLN